MKKSGALLSPILLVLGATTQIGATQLNFVKGTLSGMTLRADLIVIGDVIKMESVERQPAHPLDSERRPLFPRRVYTVRVGSVLQYREGPTCTIGDTVSIVTTHPAVGSLYLDVDGQERVLLFLREYDGMSRAEQDRPYLDVQDLYFPVSAILSRVALADSVAEREITSVVKQYQGLPSESAARARALKDLSFELIRHTSARIRESAAFDLTRREIAEQLTASDVDPLVDLIAEERFERHAAYRILRRLNEHPHLVAAVSPLLEESSP